MRIFGVLLLTTSSLLAQGGIFGFHLPPCPDGGIHDSKKHFCYYCAEGTNPLNDALLKTKRCVGITNIGTQCENGTNALFDQKKNLCSYCEMGYSFSFNKTHCYKD